jgi:acyl-CoA reductase-like NAD-dependent aldehyde dehydrogenase
LTDTYSNYIAGSWVPAKSGKTLENRNPADRDDLIGVFPASDHRDVDEAVSAARKAFRSWRNVPAPRRAEIMKRAGDILTARKEELAGNMTREMGKILVETRGDTQEGIDTAYYAFGEGRRLFTETVPSELPNKFATTTRMPVGVAGIITPWNFPIAIPTWKIFPAITCGNTVVFKPASDTPLSATTLVEILIDAGVPDGVVNLVHGTGRGVGTPIVEHAGVDLISFTGSSAVGRAITEGAAQTLKRVSLELGGKNAQIVMDDADLELALEGVLWGAFGTTGQRCTATSRLICHEKIHDRFLDMVVGRAQELKLGYGLDESVEVGPLVNQEQRRIVDEYVGIGRSEGATLCCGGKEARGGVLDRGWFYEPTVFSGVTREMRIAREEIFGPVLSVLKVGGLDEAIDAVNDSRYGLSSSIYTRDVHAAFTAVESIEAGITYINGPTIGAECHLPFGGVKETGNGHREGGWGPYDFFTEIKTVYVDYSGKLQRAQIDV